MIGVIVGCPVGEDRGGEDWVCLCGIRPGLMVFDVK